MKMPAPIEKRPRSFNEFGSTRVDDYFWLREKEDPKVRAIAEEENAYFDAVAARWKEKKERAFEGLKARVEPEATQAPYRLGRYWYGSRTPEGREHPVFYRQAAFDSTESETLLDVNELAEKHDYVQVGAFSVSWDEDRLLYSIDTDGSEHFALFCLDLRTRELRELGEKHTNGDAVWSKDQKHVFFTELNAQDRPNRVYRYRLADGHKTEIFHEKDSRFFTGVATTGDDRFLAIHTEAKESSETLLLELDRPEDAPRVFRPRQENFRYEVDSQGDRFLVLSNFEEINFRLYETAAPGDEWKPVLSGDRSKHLVGMHVFRDVYVIQSTEMGSPQIDLYSRDHRHLHRVKFPEEVYNASLYGNVLYDAPRVRLIYNSMKTPHQTWEVDLADFSTEIIHRKHIPGHDPDLYASERIFAKAADGTKIPLSLFYRKDRKRPAMQTVLNAYGAYGISSSPRFSAFQTYLADRGFLFVVAHIRGGGDLGEYWYRDGKILKKMNSFTDLIAAAETLAARGDSARDGISIYGGSAGGLLVAAAMNLRPDLFRSVVAVVPFVDVINTMLDETLPLTPGEWDEWGDPRQEEYYKYMRSYSPYDNIAAKDYPDLLMTCGWNDPRVTYWEPLKFAKKLRETRTDPGLTLLHTQMGAGHGGASGRFEFLKEMAEICGFLEWKHGL